MEISPILWGKRERVCVRVCGGGFKIQSSWSLLVCSNSVYCWRCCASLVILQQGFRLCSVLTPALASFTVVGLSKFIVILAVNVYVLCIKFNKYIILACPVPFNNDKLVVVLMIFP